MINNPPQFENIPIELQQYPHFVLWKKETIPGRDKPTKIPYQTNGHKAMSNNPKTWCTYDEAVKAFETGQFDGIGFVTSDNAPYAGIDIDNVVCSAFKDFPEVGVLVLPWAAKIVKAMDSYTETTPMRRGLRIFVEGKLPGRDGFNKRLPEGAGVEAYSKLHYLTITGDHLEGTPWTVNQRQKQLETFVNDYCGDKQAKTDEHKGVAAGAILGDHELLEKAFASANGGKIRALFDGDHSAYPSPSEADAALCQHLAFWTGGDHTAMDRLFRGSGLMRKKWDEKHSGLGETYGQTTIRKAIENSQASYNPNHHRESSMADNEETPDAFLHRLAAMSPLDYDKIRKEAAEKLGIRTKTLDETIATIRKKKESAGKLPFEDTEPHAEPVNIELLLDELKSIVSQCLICSKEAVTAITLWSALTWVIEHVHTAPLLFATSPTKRCGKTTLIRILTRLTRRTIAASSISPAALYRAVELWLPTLLIDEADAFLKDNEELRGIINSGHTRDTAYVLRTVGDTHEPTRFNTFCCKVIAGIGRQAGTIEDRSIMIQLQRKTPDEKVIRLRHIDPEIFGTLRAKLARFAEDNRKAIGRARPVLPDALNDREMDNWEPLLAIAELAGADWLKEATDAALALSGADTSTQSRGVQLLADIKSVFDDKKCKAILTEHLIQELCSDPEKPWLTYAKGKPITAKHLAGLLKEFGVHSGSVSDDSNSYITAKGYKKADFKNAFSRYLHIRGTDAEKISVKESKANDNNNISQFSCRQKEESLTDKKQDKYTETLSFDVLTDRNTQTDAQKSFDGKKPPKKYDLNGEHIEVIP